MKGKLTITIEEEDDKTFGFEIKRDGESIASWTDLTRQEQIRVLNAFVSGYELFEQNLNEE